MKKSMLVLIVVLLAVLTGNTFAATLAHYTFEEGANGSGGLGTAPSTSGWVLDSAGSVNGTAVVKSSDPEYIAADSSIPGSVAMAFGTKQNAVALGNYSQFQWSENTSKTLEFFVRRDGNGPDGSSAEFIMSKDYAGSSNSGWQIIFDRSTGLIKFTIRGNTMASTTDFRDGQWHHVAITHAANSGHYDFYIDYAKEAEIDGYAGGSVSSGHFKLGLGYGWQDQRVFNGALDEVRFSDAVLSTSEFVVPEPMTMLLMAVGGLFVSKKRRS